MIFANFAHDLFLFVEPYINLPSINVQDPSDHSLDFPMKL